jgi:hypothetical protein
MGPQGPAGPAGPAGAVGGRLPSGATIVGAYFVNADVERPSLSWGYRVPDGISIVFVPIGARPTSTCPGTAGDPAAAPGNFCIYADAGNATAQTLFVMDPLTTDYRVGHAGVVLSGINSAWSRGTWALTAP